jgi:hypothetical protein
MGMAGILSGEMTLADRMARRFCANMGGQADGSLSTEGRRKDGNFWTVSQAICDQKEAMGEIFRVRADESRAVKKKGRSEEWPSA